MLFHTQILKNLRTERVTGCSPSTMLAVRWSQTTQDLHFEQRQTPWMGHGYFPFYFLILIGKKAEVWSHVCSSQLFPNLLTN
jgi:hypothetical protein